MGALVFDPGTFTARLALERLVEMPDGQGGVIRSFTSLAEVWARIEPVSATQVVSTGAAAMTVTHRIWLRHRGDIESGMRLRKGARVFAVRTFRDPDETGRYLVCDCEEIE